MTIHCHSPVEKCQELGLKCWMSHHLVLYLLFYKNTTYIYNSAASPLSNIILRFLTDIYWLASQSLDERCVKPPHLSWGEHAWPLKASHVWYFCCCNHLMTKYGDKFHLLWPKTQLASFLMSRQKTSIWIWPRLGSVDSFGLYGNTLGKYFVNCVISLQFR